MNAITLLTLSEKTSHLCSLVRKLRGLGFEQELDVLYRPESDMWAISNAVGRTLIEHTSFESCTMKLGELVNTQLQINAVLPPEEVDRLTSIYNRFQDKPPVSGHHDPVPWFNSNNGPSILLPDFTNDPELFLDIIKYFTLVKRVRNWMVSLKSVSVTRDPSMTWDAIEKTLRRLFKVHNDLYPYEIKQCYKFFRYDSYILEIKRRGVGVLPDEPSLWLRVDGVRVERLVYLSETPNVLPNGKPRDFYYHTVYFKGYTLDIDRSKDDTKTILSVDGSNEKIEYYIDSLNYTTGTTYGVRALIANYLASFPISVELNDQPSNQNP